MSGRGVKKIFLLAITLIIACISPLVFLSGCTQDSGEETYWYTDPPEVFYTNDLERAREEMPFTLVLPTYLPDDIPSLPYMVTGSVKGTCPEDEMWIKVTYSAGFTGSVVDDSGPSIDVREINSFVALERSGSDTRYLNIAGIQVLYEASNVLTFDSSGNLVERRGPRYLWNQGGMHFEVDVFEYDEDEAIKIVESMIEQIE